MIQYVNVKFDNGERGVIVRFEDESTYAFQNFESGESTSQGRYLYDNFFRYSWFLGYREDFYSYIDDEDVSVAEHDVEEYGDVMEIDCIEDYSLDGVVRPEPVNLISERYEKQATYSGFHGYHHSHSCYFNRPMKESSKPWKIGIELEMEAKDRMAFRAITEGRSNTFFYESDSSLASGVGIEAITVPLRSEDAKDPEFWSQPIREWSKLAKSWKSPRCGLHVHIGREIFGTDAEKATESVGKLLYFYEYFMKHSPVNIKVFGRAEGYHELSAKNGYGDAVNVVGKDALGVKSVCKKLGDSMRSKASEGRYFDINISNSATVEFRKGKGSLNVDRVVSVVTYCELMCLYVIRTKWTDLSHDGFIEYIRKNTKKDNPLMRWVPEGEIED